MMMKLSNELKTVPNWFENINKEKFYDNQVPLIRYLIWIMQANCVFSAFYGFFVMTQMTAITASGMGANPAWFTMMSLFFVTIPLTQITILGVQARSKLAWLFLATFALRMTFSMALPFGVLMLILLDQDSVIEYFNTL